MLNKYTEQEMNDIILNHIRVAFLATADATRQLAHSFRCVRYQNIHRNNLASFKNNNISRIH